MNIGLIRPFFDGFHDAVIGLRTGQSGRASTAFTQLTNILSDLTTRMSVADQLLMLPTLATMAEAMSRNDSTSLSDLLEYKLPIALAHTEYLPGLMNLRLLDALRFDQREYGHSLPRLLRRLKCTIQRFPEVQGLTLYYAAPMVLDGAYSAARKVIELESGDSVEMPAIAYLRALVSAYEGDDHEAIAYMDRAYSASETLRNGYIQIAKHILRRGQHEKALAVAKMDESSGRATPHLTIELAQMYGIQGNFNHAESLVASAYRANSSLRNGFARLSGIQSEARNWEEAFRLAIRDHQQGRMSPDWQLNLAQLYGRRGEFERATSLILGAYEADSFLQNGFARLGWIRAETQDWEGALELSARDARLSRISPLWQMHLALIHGRLGEFKSASTMMESAYQADSSLISGFCRLGWIRAEKKDWNGAFELAARDERLARLSPTWQVNLAQLYGHRGEFEHAVTMIQSAYEGDSSLKDGFVRLGWIRAEAKDLEGALELSVIDERERRLSPPWQLKLAQLYGHRGDFEHAVSLIHTAYQSDSSLENGFVHLAWIRGNAGDWACALDLARKDEELGRLSPTWAMNLEAIRQYHFSQ